MNRQQPICESCGQPVIQPTELPPLTKIQQRIFDLVRRYPGLSTERLRALVWDGPDGGPESRQAIFVHLSLLNSRLAPLKIAIRSEGGVYKIRSVT
jgi:hypothetical protein